MLSPTPRTTPEYDPDGDRDVPGPRTARELHAEHPAGFERAYAEYLADGCESADDPIGAATIEGFLINADANDWAFTAEGERL